MKRGLLIILIICLLLPAVSATIDIDGPSQSRYNVGDTVTISGSILEDEDLTGYLQLTVECYDEDFPLQRIPFDIYSGERVQLSSLNLPNIIITSSMDGYCHIKAQTIVSGNVIDEETSSSFEVVKDMEGTFDVSDTLFQLGDTLSLDGKVEKLDGTKIDGSAEIYFEQDGIEYLVDAVAIIGGYLNYDYQFVSGYPGEYDINLLVRDYFGNMQAFSNVGKFDLIDDLYVTVDSSADSFLPGEDIIVTGEVKTAQKTPVSSASVSIGFGDELYSASLVDSEFTYAFVVPRDIESGDHKLIVTVKDSYDNEGTSYKTIEVDPLASSIDVELSNYTLFPEEELEIVASLYDQAGDLMEGLVELQVIDSDLDLISERDVQSGKSVMYDIPQFGRPGTWEISVSYDELVDDETLTVDIVRDLEINMENDVLYIRNIGNTRYIDDIELEVESDNAKYMIKRSKNLDVNETMAIDLAEEVPTGVYSLGLPTGNTISDLVIEDGTTRTSMTWAYIFLALLFVGGLSYLVYLRVGPKLKERKLKKKKAKKFVKNDEPPMKVDSKKKSKKKKPSLQFESKEKGVADFKHRVLGEIKKTEAKIKKGEDQKKLASVLPPKKGSGGNNPFSLFD
tara:strand:+ start:6441 stop:8306 length:1866 start_codon:yes stop_codon:yes gene_type:complete